jgi:hypothetical protein
MGLNIRIKHLWADSFVCYTIAHPHIQSKILDKFPHYQAPYQVQHLHKWSGPYYGAFLLVHLSRKQFLVRSGPLLRCPSSLSLSLSHTFELKTISCPLNVPLDMEKRRPKRGNTKLSEESKVYTIKVLCFSQICLLNGIRSSSHVLPTNKWFP